MVPPQMAARRLGLTLVQFREAREALCRDGMPVPCPVTGYYDLVAIDAWVDRRSGLAAKDVSASAAERIRAKLSVFDG